MTSLPSDRLSDYERGLFARVEQGAPLPDWHQLDAETLEAITAREGIDFAAALLYLRLRQSEEHGPWMEELEHEEKEHGPRPTNPMLLVGIVPGGCHEESRESRESLRLVREQVRQLGFTTETLPVDSFGTLPEQARIVRDWLRERSDREIILVSLSKGGAEVKLAMHGQPEVFRHVAAWVDVSGLLFGSQWVSWLLNRTISRWGARLWCWYWGYPFAAVEQLRRGPQSLLDFDLRPPKHMKVIHVYGVPLTTDLSHPHTRRSFSRLSSRGPNDGVGVMLGDLVRLPGRVYPVWRADHFLRPRGQDLRDFVGRVLTYLVTQR